MTTATPPQQPLTVQEAAEFLRISQATLYRRIADGSVKARKIGGLTRFFVKDLEKALREQR